MPKELSWVGNKYVNYFYTFDGEKLRKTVENNGTISKIDYCGIFVYETNSGTRSLKYIITPEGRALKNGSTWKYEYNLKDHLGNVRAVINDAGALVQEKHYYPFGMEMSSWSSGTSTNKYLYNGKELENDFELGYYDYGARFYDPALGRWHSVDPLAEDYNNLSPYNYVANNPLKYIDPNGMSIDNYGVDKDGNVSLLEKTDDDYDVLYAVDNSGNKTDTNGDGKVGESDGAKVNDKSILPELTKVEDLGDGKKLSQAQTTASSNDALSIFKFASDNSNVEWSLTRFSSGDGEKYSISTYHMESLSPGLGPLGISESSTITRWHSHPGTVLRNERSSMGETSNGSGGNSDLSQAIRRYNRNNKTETYPMNVYFPKSKNFYHVAPWGLKLKGKAR